jgi:hypothetical protein
MTDSVAQASCLQETRRKRNRSRFGVDLYNDGRLNRAKTPADLAQLVQLKLGAPTQVNN